MKYEVHYTVLKTRHYIGERFLYALHHKKLKQVEIPD